MMSAKELAKYIISTIKERMTDIQPEEFDVTPLKLQKLLYYCQGYSLALTGKPAFKDKVEAWRYGPVIDSVYQEYKKYTGGIIPYNDITVSEVPDEALRSIVDLVLADKGHYSGEALARMTHNEPTWENSYSGSFGGVYVNAEISQSSMKNYFSEVFREREEDYKDEDVFWDKISDPVNKSELEAILEGI